MANIKTKGIVIRQRDYGEADRMLTIFTEEHGIIKAAAHGARRTRSKQSAASQFLCFGEFMLYRGGGDVANVNSVTPIDSFYPIQEDISKLALGTYFADVLYHILDSANPDAALLRLFLNTLYALAYKNMSAEKIKTVFEWRAMALGGFMPQLGACVQCGQTDAPARFRIRSGAVLCAQCGSHNDIKLDELMLIIMRYAICADDKKLFSFRAPDDVIKRVSDLSEKYTAHHLEHEFESLKYYKRLQDANGFVKGVNGDEKAGQV